MFCCFIPRIEITRFGSHFVRTRITGHFLVLSGFFFVAVQFRMQKGEVKFRKKRRGTGSISFVARFVTLRCAKQIRSPTSLGNVSCSAAV